MGTFVSSRQVRMNINLLAPYQGAGDIVSTASLWVGLRAYTRSTAGTNAVRLRRDSDNAEQDFATLAGSGALDTASITTFKGAAGLFVAKLYDQSGNGNDLVQASAGAQPQFILSGIGSLPVIRYTGTGEQLSDLSFSVSQPYTFSWVAKRTGNLTSTAAVLGSNGGHRSGFLNSNNTAFVYANLAAVSGTAADNSFHAVQGVANGASSDCNINGTPNTGNAGTGILTGVFLTNVDAALIGDVVECGVWPVAFSGANSSAMSANQHSYWGF